MLSAVILTENVFARICKGLRLDRSRAAVCKPIVQRDLQDAEWWLGLVSLYDLKKHVTENKKTGKLNCSESLNISWSQGLPVAKGRMGHGTMKGIIGHSQLKVLSSKSRLAHLLIMQCHEEDHRLGPQDAVFRSIRQGYLVLGARRLAIKVLKDCYYCKRVRAKQRMDSLPPQIFEIPVRPWTKISLDFVAPMLARDEVRRRVTRKCYPIVFCCINTGACHIGLSPSYNTEDFITQLNHFFALRGRSVTIYCDASSIPLLLHCNLAHLLIPFFPPRGQ